LLCLQERSKWYYKKCNSEVDDIVLIVEANVKNTYVLARVTETLVGNDRLVRCVKLRAKDGYLERPISKLCLVLKHESKSALNLP